MFYCEYDNNCVVKLSSNSFINLYEFRTPQFLRELWWRANALDLRNFATRKKYLLTLTFKLILLNMRVMWVTILFISLIINSNFRNAITRRWNRRLFRSKRSGKAIFLIHEIFGMSAFVTVITINFPWFNSLRHDKYRIKTIHPEKTKNCTVKVDNMRSHVPILLLPDGFVFLNSMLNIEHLFWISLNVTAVFRDSVAVPLALMSCVLCE